jgi:hypothetical protein
LDDHPDLDADRDGQEPPPPASGPAEGAVAVPGPAPGHPTREAPEVTVPIWRLTPKQRAELLRIVEAGGRAQRRGIPSEQLSSLAEAGYLAVYDDGLVMLTPAALRAITIEVDRRAAARDAATGERGHHRPPLSS